jgi:hypothetical protein
MIPKTILLFTITIACSRCQLKASRVDTVLHGSIHDYFDKITRPLSVSHYSAEGPRR